MAVDAPSDRQLDDAILTTIAYFDVYACAPTFDEVHRFCAGVSATRGEVEARLQQSPRLGQALRHAGPFWFLAGKAHLAPRRVRFLEHSRRLWPEAYKMGRRVERTRLATAGLVTGSLAADNADEHADIDFLFTYPAERTWTSYALVRVLQKAPGLGLGNLCPNYALPDDRLEIRPQNLFTAWELAKAVPIFGFGVYRRLLEQNTWARRYLPNAFGEPPGPDASAHRDPGWLSRVVESGPFRRLEAAEKRRKFSRERRDVGVDMRAREAKGEIDRHSPTRSFQALGELRYRMEKLDAGEHPLYQEIASATEGLAEEMVQWAGESISGALDSGPTSRAS